MKNGDHTREIQRVLGQSELTLLRNRAGGVFPVNHKWAVCPDRSPRGVHTFFLRPFEQSFWILDSEYPSTVAVSDSQVLFGICVCPLWDMIFGSLDHAACPCTNRLRAFEGGQPVIDSVGAHMVLRIQCIGVDRLPKCIVTVDHRVTVDSRSATVYISQ